MTQAPSRSDLIELGRRAEHAYDRAERMLGPAGAPGCPSLEEIDAGIGRDVWRRYCELRGSDVRFPDPRRLAALGGVVTLSVDRETRRLESGDAEAYVMVGSAVWQTAAGAGADA